MRADLTTDERALMLAMHPDEHLLRPAFPSQPFKLAWLNLNDRRHGVPHAPELVARLCAKGMMKVCQAAPVIPPRTEVIPFSVQFTKDGLEERAKLVGDDRFDPANDARREVRVA